MQQDERPPAPMSLVVEVDAVDLRVLARALRVRGPIGAHCHAPSTGEKSGSADTDSAGAWNSSVRSKTAQERDPRCKNVVDLDQDDQSDADPCGKYHAKQSRARVERLCDQNASAHEHRAD